MSQMPEFKVFFILKFKIFIYLFINFIKIKENLDIKNERKK